MNTSIIKKGDKYYFTEGTSVFELNENTFARLKNGLTLPTTVYFRDCPFDFIGQILSQLFDESVNMDIKRIKDTSDYEASFTKAYEKGL